MAAVVRATEADLRPPCLECGGITHLVPVREAFPHATRRSRSPVAWLCECGAAVSCHPDSHRPLGYAAGAATTRARMAAHHALDAALAAGVFGPPHARQSRAHAYVWLSDKMATPDFHFARSALDGCERAIRLLRAAVRDDTAA